MTEQTLREKNLETVKKFLECRGPLRGVSRAPLFCEGATQEIAFPTEKGFEYRKTPCEEWLTSTAESFPDWGFYDNMIFQTEDPNVFVVKSHGVGHMVEDGKQIPVEHFYVNEFRMKDGLIKMFRETPNPCEEYNPYQEK